MFAFWYSPKYKIASIIVTLLVLTLGNLSTIMDVLHIVPNTYHQQYQANAGKTWYVGPGVSIGPTTRNNTQLVIIEQVLYTDSNGTFHRGQVTLECLNKADAFGVGPIALSWIYTRDLKVTEDAARSLCSYALVG
jgi:hypothetical protein